MTTADDNTIHLKSISTSVPQDVWADLEAERKAQDRTMAAHVRRILREHVERIRRPAAYPELPWQPAAPVPKPYVAPPDPDVKVRWEDDPALAGKVGAQPNSRDYSNDEGLS